MISSVALRGDSGAIAIDTERLRLFGGGTIGTANFGSGSAGDVRVSASDQIEVTGVLRPGVPTRLDSSILSLPIPGISTLPTAHAGTVTLTTGRLLVSNGAEIAVRNEGTGNGGRLEINANEIKVDSAQLAASTRLGDGGDILLNVRDSLLLRDRAQILTNSKGNGGDITINAPVIVGINNSDIIANAIAGRGGNITINTQSLIGLAFRNLDNPINTPTNDISARSERNVSGNVNITTPKVDPDAGLIQLDTDLIDTSQTVAVGCAEEQSSQFIFTGRGGMPTNPSHQMNATLQPWVDLRSHPRSTQAVMSSSPRLQEATTWKRGATGQVELIAEHPTDPAAIATCAK